MRGSHVGSGRHRLVRDGSHWERAAHFVGGTDFCNTWFDGSTVARALSSWYVRSFHTSREITNGSVKNEGSYFLPGAAYSFSASASLGVRVWQPGCIFSGLAPYIAISPSAGPIMAGILSSRLYTLFLRSLADKLRLRADYVNDLPEVPDSLLRNTELAEYALWCISSSQARARIDPVESDFHPLVLPKTHQEYFSYVYPYDVIRLLIQERFENAVGIAFNLGSHERQVLDRKNGLFISFGTWVRWSTR